MMKDHSALLKEVSGGKPVNQDDPKKKAIIKRLMGMKDSRSSVGIAARGKNVYNSGSHAAHRGGGPQYGRPKKGRLNGNVKRR